MHYNQLLPPFLVGYGHVAPGDLPIVDPIAEVPSTSSALHAPLRRSGQHGPAPEFRGCWLQAQRGVEVFCHLEHSGNNNVMCLFVRDRDIICGRASESKWSWISNGAREWLLFNSINGNMLIMLNLRLPVKPSPFILINAYCVCKNIYYKFKDSQDIFDNPFLDHHH